AGPAPELSAPVARRRGGRGGGGDQPGRAVPAVLRPPAVAAAGGAERGTGDEVLRPARGGVGAGGRSAEAVTTDGCEVGSRRSPISPPPPPRSHALRGNEGEGSCTGRPPSRRPDRLAQRPHLGDHPVEDAQRRPDLRGGDAQRRAEPYRALATAE